MISLASLASGPRTWVLGIVVMLLTGCAGQEVDPCGLLTLEEVRTLEPRAQGAERHAAATSQAADNALCVWHDGGDQVLLMLFYFLPPSAPPAELVASGMAGSQASIVTVEGVGEGASAGFGTAADGSLGQMGLFAASTGEHTIGLRVQGIDDVQSQSFLRLKQLANTALSRL